MVVISNCTRSGSTTCIEKNSSELPLQKKFVERKRSFTGCRGSGETEAGAEAEGEYGDDDSDTRRRNSTRWRQRRESFHHDDDDDVDNDDNATTTSATESDANCRVVNRPRSVSRTPSNRAERGAHAGMRPRDGAHGSTFAGRPRRPQQLIYTSI